MKRIGLLAICIAITACSVKSNPAKTTVYTPLGKIENHCPPGQAKKGNCVK